MYEIYKKRKEINKEDLAKYTKGILILFFGWVCLLVSLAIFGMVVISPIIILQRLPFLVELIPSQLLIVLSVVLVILMFIPAVEIYTRLWDRLMPEKKESEEAEKTKTDKGGQ